MKSALIIKTETTDVAGKKVVVAHIPEGGDKPYMDKDGLIFVKNGSDKHFPEAEQFNVIIPRPPLEV